MCSLGKVPRQREPSLRLYIDGWCARCRAAGRLIAALDRAGRVAVVSFRDDRSYLQAGLTPADLDARMYLVDMRTGTARGGYAGILALAGALPPLWPLLPFLAVAGWLGLGARVYRYLATHRRILPDPRACAATGCPHSPAILERDERCGHT